MNIIVNIGFVQIIRAVEQALGIPNSYPGLITNNAAFMNVTEAIATTARSSTLPSEIRLALQDSISMFTKIASELRVNTVFDQNGLRSRLASGSRLVSKYGLISEFISAHHVHRDNFSA